MESKEIAYYLKGRNIVFVWKTKNHSVFGEEYINSSIWYDEEKELYAYYSWWNNGRDQKPTYKTKNEIVELLKKERYFHRFHYEFLFPNELPYIHPKY